MRGRRRSRRARSGAAVAHGARPRPEDADGDRQGSGSRRLGHRGLCAQPWARRPGRRARSSSPAWRSSYWDDVFPLPDDYGVETRVAPVTGLNGRDGNGSLIQPLHKLALFNRGRRHRRSPSISTSSRSSLPSLDAERRQQRIEAGAIPFDDMEKEARAAGAAPIRRAARRRAARRCEAWQAMAAVLDEKASEDPPSTSARARPDRGRSARSPTATRRRRQPRAGGSRRRRRGARRRRAGGGWRRRCGGIAVPAGRGRRARTRCARWRRSPTSSADRAAFAAVLHAGRGGAPRPHDLAGPAGGDRRRHGTRRQCDPHHARHHARRRRRRVGADRAGRTRVQHAGNRGAGL